LAALEAGIQIAQLEGRADQAALYGSWLEAGRVAYETRLWNGSYYDFDASGGTHSDSIMADQLAGAWYADAAGLPPFLPEHRVLSALQAVYANNVQKFADGQLGAVNGMRPDGTVDDTSDQSHEVWSGATYALAAFMIGQGMEAEGWATAWGIYNVTYNRGLWFRTPEAWLRSGDYRACMYMRPLAVWAIEAALTGIPSSH
jgi:non-lysosomal glucosylceramidase